MENPDNIIEKRQANALFQDVEVSTLSKLLLFGAGERTTFAISRKFMGGMWVGGDAYLTPDVLIFKPNFINRLAHKHAESLALSIPLVEVQSVERRFGILTKIIDLKIEGATFSIRCYRSEGFADAIEKARASSGGGADGSVRTED